MQKMKKAEKFGAKKFLAGFLAMVMMAGLVPVMMPEALAETFSGTCGDDLTWTLDTDTGVLEISGTGTMANYSNPNTVAP